jgi:hypothetical protein
LFLFHQGKRKERISFGYFFKSIILLWLQKVTKKIFKEILDTFSKVSTKQFKEAVKIPKSPFQ